MVEYSILMSVYCEEKPEFLRDSIQSMLNQTVPTNDFVIVCDGPLTAELDDVIYEFVSSRPDLFQIIRLPENLGIGGAANEGIKYCKNDLIAKMDSDDISVKDRCEIQLKMFGEDNSLGIIGSQLAEFRNQCSNVVAIRNVPLELLEINKYAKRRMPFNNQTIMYKKHLVELAGGYSPTMRRCEDYDLFSRMLYQGVKAKNIDEILVFFRLDEDAYRRRGTWDNLKGFVHVRWLNYKRGFCSFSDFLIPCAGQIIISFLPTGSKDFFYKLFLRKNNFSKSLSNKWSSRKFTFL